MKSFTRMLAGLLPMLALLAAPAFAADLHGTVAASTNGTPIIHAQVVLHGPHGLQLTTSTDSEGNYSFTGLEATVHYSVDVDAQGFNSFTQDITLSSPSQQFDILLDLITHHESVMVRESGGVLTLQSSAPDVSQIITPAQIAALPSASRNVTKYALLDPHVRQTQGSASDGNNGNRLSFNAESHRYTGYILDGVINYDWTYSNGPYQLVPASAVSDVSVITNQYAAEYGTSTTGVVKVETKSGTRQLSGEVFVYLLPSGIQANAPVATFHVPNQRWEWGVLLGGPLVKDKTFFFVDYEGINQQRGSFIQSPTPMVYVGEGHEAYGLARIDHNLTDSHALALRLNIYHYRNTNANDRVGGFNQISFGRMERSASTGGQVSDRLVIGSNLVNYFRVNYNSYSPDNNGPGGIYIPSVGISRASYSISGFSQNNWDRSRLLDLSDNVAWNHGRHNFKFGAEVVRVKVTDFLTNQYGTYTFNAGPPVVGEHPASFQQIFGTAFLRFGDTIWQAYFQDDFKISSRLSANVGLRYEYQATTDSVHRLGPRVGLAWDVRGNGKTRVTLGAGMFYASDTYNELRRALRSNEKGPLFTYTIPWGVAGFPTFPNSLTAPPTSVQAARADIVVRPPNYLNPYSMQASVGVERDLGGKFALIAHGIWSHTVHQLRDYDLNHPAPFIRTAPGQTRSATAADATRPYTTYKGASVRDIVTFTNDNSTVYGALDVGIRRLFGARLQTEAHYVWAYQSSYGDIDDWKPNEWNNLGSAEKGPGNYYQRHRAVGNLVVELPYGFRFSQIMTVASGLPFTPLTGVDNNGDSYRLDRPIGYKRNSLRTPRQFAWDMALGKQFKVTERFGIEARGEFFNIINHNNPACSASQCGVNVTYGNAAAPVATFETPVAGIANIDPSRRIQFALRFLIGRQSFRP
jgi:hypothetical protein